jgi:anti-sigma regulatory factor (Ser/Thr protein kinase)
VLDVDSRPAGAARGFRHEALMYDGEDEFVATVSDFVASAVRAEEPILVAVAPEKIDRLRRRVGSAGPHLEFADMTQLGANPARILPAWRAFVDRHPEAPRLRGVGEPVWQGRRPAELAECELHESLLNMAFPDAVDFHLMCPYDAAALDAGAIEVAEHTHPAIDRLGRVQPSDSYGGPASALELFTRPLPWPDVEAAELRFSRGPLHDVRRFVAEAARRAGLADRRVDDVVLAANEIVSNSVLHGGGSGVVRTWQHDGVLVCEVRDAGRIADPLVGRARPRREEIEGRGVWMANELCDLVQIRSPESGTVVRLHMNVDPAL